MKKLIIIASVAALFASCSKEGWKVNGTIENAPENAKLSIEGFNGAQWYNIDSVAISSDGKFAYASPEGAPYPDVYRVSLEGKSIYFPIDSLESITITANGEKFDTDYNMTGWQTAEEMMKIDKRIAEAVAAKGVEAVLADSVLKRDLSVTITNDENGILGYYIINKTVGNRPLFSVDDKHDLRIIGAIANKFNTKYPNDPRTAFLTQRFLKARSEMNDSPMGKIVEATESGLVNIELYDAHGTKQSLGEIAKNAGVTLLSFTSYQMESSVPYNVELNRLYEQFKPQNIAIYQVSLDNDEVQWRTNAANLPWTAVWYDNKDGGRLPLLYNLSVVPTTFIIDRNGDLVERVDNPLDLESSILKHL